MLFLTTDSLIAVRDPRGFRPLALGCIGGAWVRAGSLTVSSPMFLSSSTLWPTIKKLSKAAKTRSYVAAPYLGCGSADLLPLGEGDVLICALTLANARSGVVSPADVEKLRGRGVEVYLRENLHAKIYLFGRTAIVCSANVSRTSESVLDEAGIMTSDGVVVRAVRDWFTSRMGEPVTPEWLKRCADAYRPPRGGLGAPRVTKGEQRVKRRVWLVRTAHLDEFPEFEKAEFQAGYQEARGRLARPRVYSVYTLRSPMRSRFEREAKTGDLIVEVENEGKRWRPSAAVYPHGKVLNKRVTRTRTGGRVAYFYIETPTEPRTVQWRELCEECKAAGLALPRSIVAREVRNHRLEDKLLTILSPERLRRKMKR